MPRFLARTAFAFLAAILFGAAAHGGELARPVPSDAQVTRFTRFNIRYTLRDIVAQGVRKVDFYITDDMGATWKYYGEDTDKTSPMTVEVPGEGVYGFVCVVTDRHGNREREPGPRTRPETVIVVDRTPPSAKWLAPTQDVLGRGQTVEMQWESSDDYMAENPVKIQYAANAQGNHDRNANWQTAREGLPANGSFTWTPPDSSTYNFRLVAEDRAGNMAVAYCAATIRIDNTPPYVVSVTPLRSNKLENDITVEARDNDGGSGVKEYSLYTSENGSATWTLVKENTVGGESIPVKRANGGSITWKAPRSGDYPLWPVVFDEAGNATSLPSVGVTGAYVLTIDNEPPTVSLSSSFLQGRAAVLANETRRIEWTAYDAHISEGSGKILLSLDNGNTWQELRSGLPTNGFETINFPFGSQSEEAKLKVTVEDDFGNVGEGISETFKLSAAETTIESVTPRSTASDGQDPFGTGFGEPAAPAPATPVDSGLGSWFGGDTTTTAPIGGGTYTPPPALPTQQGGGFAPFGGTPGGDIYGGGSDLYGSFSTHSDESTAGSVPQAILGGRGGSSTTTSPSSPFGASVPPPPPGGFGQQQIPAQPVDSTGLGWQSSPGAGLAGSGQSDGLGGWQSSAPSSSGLGGSAATSPWDAASGLGGGLPVPPPPGGGSAVPPPAGTTDLASIFGTGQQQAVPPPAPASTPSTDLSSLFGGDVVAPPPMAQDQPGMPSLSTPDTGLSLGNLGGTPIQQLDVQPPTGALRPPSFGDPAPAAPTDTASAGSSSQPWPGVSTGMPPVAQSGPPPAMPQIDGGLDSQVSIPQPIDSSLTQRPVDGRQASIRLTNEARSLREDGQVEAARNRGERAVEADPANPGALMELSQIYARMVPPDYVRAANLAKEATNLEANWETWWNCSDIFYIWANTTNREIQAMLRTGQTPPINFIDERNSTLSNAQIAVNNAASVLPQGDRDAARKVAVTQGMIAYQRALTIPEPGADQDKNEYKNMVTPLLREAVPLFENAMNAGGAPEYRELFQLGIINFRLAGLERDTGNASQAITHYQSSIQYLEQATTASNTPKEGPREAYYMLALSHDQVSALPGPERGRHKELALRYWRQTADFYEPDSTYHIYATQRIDALNEEMGL